MLANCSQQVTCRDVGVHGELQQCGVRIFFKKTQSGSMFALDSETRQKGTKKPKKKKDRLLLLSCTSPTLSPPIFSSRPERITLVGVGMPFVASSRVLLACTDHAPPPLSQPVPLFDDVSAPATLPLTYTPPLFKSATPSSESWHTVNFAAAAISKGAIKKQPKKKKRNKFVGTTDTKPCTFCCRLK